MLNIDMDLLRTFALVADLNGVTRAADRLGRSQPAISLQLQRLEGLLGTALFHRSRQGLALTETGQLLRGYAERILTLNDEAVSRLAARKTIGTVRVGLPNDYAVSVLPESLGRFSDAHLDAMLTVGCALSTELLASLDAGAYDLVIAMTAEPPTRPTVRVWREELVWVGRPGAGAKGEEPLPLIVYPEGCVYRERMVKALNAAGRPWRMTYTSPKPLQPDRRRALGARRDGALQAHRAGRARGPAAGARPAGARARLGRALSRRRGAADGGRAARRFHPGELRAGVEGGETPRKSKSARCGGEEGGGRKPQARAAKAKPARDIERGRAGPTIVARPATRRRRFPCLSSRRPTPTAGSCAWRSPRRRRRSTRAACRSAR